MGKESFEMLFEKKVKILDTILIQRES